MRRKPHVPAAVSASSRAEAALVVLAALLAGLPLLSGRVLGGHDVATYLMYAPEVAGLLREGVFLPAWASDLNAGFGGPGLLFYPPLVNLPHALLLLAGIPPALGVGLVAVALLAASGLAVLAWLRSSGLGSGALAGALVYVASPYRLVDLYERTALSEHLSFVFPPLALWALASSRPASPTRRAALVALAVAGLLLSNFPAAVLFGAALAASVLHPAVAGRRLAAVAGASLGAGLAAFALVPAALSGRWCAVELFYSGASPVFRPSQHVLFGPAELNPEFGRRVSWALLALAALLLVAFLAGRLRGPADPRRGLWGALALAAFLAVLPPAGSLWDALPLLSKLQFPWRLATVLTLALPPLVALLPRRAAFALAAAAATMSLPWYGRLTAPLAAVPLEAPAFAAPGTAFPEPLAVHDAAGLSAHPWMRNPDLLDVWFVPRDATPPFWRALLAGNSRASVPELATAPVASRSGPLAWRLESRGRLSQSVVVDAPGGTLLLHQLFFPGFRTFVDGVDRPARPDPRTGILSVEVPPGRHAVAWRWEPFAPLPAARVASAAAVALLVALLAFPSLRRTRPAPEA